MPAPKPPKGGYPQMDPPPTPPKGGSGQSERTRTRCPHCSIGMPCLCGFLVGAAHPAPEPTNTFHSATEESK